MHEPCRLEGEADMVEIKQLLVISVYLFLALRLSGSPNWFLEFS